MRRHGIPVRDERGAVALMAALMTLLLLVVASFVVDLGMQRVVRRDMQALADVVAFDMSRQLDGRRAGVILASSSWSTALQNSLARNLTSGGRKNPLGDRPVVSAEVGALDDAGHFQVMTGSTAADVPTAVRVTARGSVPFSIPVVSSRGGATRNAVATQRRQACIELGSYAATVRSGDSRLLSSLLGRINSAFGIGGSAGLTAVGYEGLANAKVSAAALAAALGLASPEQLGTASITYGRLLDATATVLTNSGNTTAASTVRSIRNNLGAMTGTTIPVGTLLTVATGNGSAADANLNVLDLIAGSAMAINGSTALSVPDLSVTALGLASGTSALSVIQGKQRKCGFRGETLVETSQATLEVTGALGDTSLPIGGGSAAPVQVRHTTTPTKLTLNLAKATGTLDDVRCPTTEGATPSTAFGATVGVTSGVSSTHLEVPVQIVTKVSVAGLGLVDVTIDATYVVDNISRPATKSVPVVIPPQTFDTAYASGTGRLELGNVTSASATGVVVTAKNALGLPVSLATTTKLGLLDLVAGSVVNPLINTMNSVALRRVGNLLGVGVAGADVFLLGPRLVCDSPALRG